jgi:hypothetical protein
VIGNDWVEYVCGGGRKREVHMDVKNVEGWTEREIRTTGDKIHWGG